VIRDTRLNTTTPTAPAQASINHDAPRTRLIAGVSVPDNPLITAVIEYAQRLSEPYLFNHAMRSWLFAETIGRIRGIHYDHEVWLLARYSTTSASLPVCLAPIASR
jgi:hypothetical protein